ncbi:hypothetical protein B0H19DRAFT_1228171, partial [Mycena capillaripes]
MRSSGTLPNTSAPISRRAWRVQSTEYLFCVSANGSQIAADFTFWIRHSTGRLCADLAQPIIPIGLYGFWSTANTQRVISWNEPNKEGMIIESLTLKKYHLICVCALRRHGFATIVTPIRVDLGTVVFRPSTNRFEDSVGIALSPNVE